MNFSAKKKKEKKKERGRKEEGGEEGEGGKAPEGGREEGQNLRLKPHRINHFILAFQKERTKSLGQQGISCLTVVKD